MPRDIVKLLVAAGCAVSPFPNQWKGTKNGRLLALIRTAGYDCLLTCDKNMQHQQNIASSGIAVVVLPTQALWRLRQHVGEIAEGLEHAERGQALTVLFREKSR